MYRPDRNLVKAFTFDWQKAIGWALGHRLGLIAKWMAYTPAVVVEPRPPVGQARRLDPKQISCGPLQAHRRRMALRDRRIASTHAFQTDDGDPAGRFVEQRHMGRLRLDRKSTRLNSSP